MRPTVCDKCYDKHIAKEKSIGADAGLPFNVWDFKKGNNALLKAILRAAFGSTTPTEKQIPFSLFVHGRTGLCKTRAICEAASRFVAVGGWVRFMSAHKAMAGYSELLGTSMSQAGQYRERVSSYSGLLILDDLGVGAITERSMEFLFSLVDRRVSSTLPTWITSNYDYERLVGWIAKHDTEYAERIVRRISDLCIVIDSERVKA